MAQVIWRIVDDTSGSTHPRGTITHPHQVRGLSLREKSGEHKRENKKKNPTKKKTNGEPRALDQRRRTKIPKTLHQLSREWYKRKEVGGGGPGREESQEGDVTRFLQLEKSPFPKERTGEKTGGIGREG